MPVVLSGIRSGPGAEKSCHEKDFADRLDRDLHSDLRRKDSRHIEEMLEYFQRMQQRTKHVREAIGI